MERTVPLAIEPAGHNWAGSYQYRAAGAARPRSLAALQEAVVGSDRVKALGSRHSFSDIADSDGLLLDLSSMPTQIDIDSASKTVVVPGSLRYGDVASYVNARGWALRNLASLPHISVAGSIATGTHGSGDQHGVLGTSVAALDIVTAAGELVHLARGDRDFDGAVVSLGALGIVTNVTLDIEPTFDIWQRVYAGPSFDVLVDDFDSISASGYSVSIFTDWRGNAAQSSWVKSRTSDGAAAGSLLGTGMTAQIHMIDGQPEENTTPQLGLPGPWHERLPHFRLGFTPSAGDEIQSEYLLAREQAGSSIEAMRSIAHRLADTLLISEIRTVARDDLWLSPASGRDTIALHFTWRRDPEALARLLPAVEDLLLPLGARPHWGKVFVTSSLRSLYPSFDDFRALTSRIDPNGKFRNTFMDRVGL
jgi:xylitol oxidase